MKGHVIALGDLFTSTRLVTILCVVLCRFSCAPLMAAQSVSQSSTRGAHALNPTESKSSGYARCHAVIVGVDHYDDPHFPDLNHAATDARGVARVLEERFGFEDSR